MKQQLLLFAVLLGLSFSTFAQHIDSRRWQEVTPSSRFQIQKKAPVLHPLQQGNTLLPIRPGTPIAARQVKDIHDPRQLPISANGKVLSPDSLEIDFVVPRGNLQGPMGCATPIPVINDGNASSRANCPITDLCDRAGDRDAVIPGATDPIKYFKMRWTVIDNGTANSNINQTRVNDLIDELNAEYLPWRIQFCADAARFITDANLYSIDINTDDAALKNAYGDSTAQMINIYVIGSITTATPGGSGQIAGYAYFPNSIFGGTNSRGGIVMARIGAGLGAHVLSHEMGHVFGLHHTFHGVDEVTTCTACYERVTAVSGAGANGDTEGDWCSDTNPTPTNPFVCTDPAGPANVCDAFTWNNTPLTNHMSYSNCRAQFTPQQAGRMHCFINAYLGSWLSFGAATCGNQPPIANFQGSPTYYVAPSTVNFTDLSTPQGLVTNWKWVFDVGNTGLGSVMPATFTGQNPPSVLYPNVGSYTVRLTVFNSNGDSTVEEKTNYITVIAPSNDCDTLDTQWLTPAPSPNVYLWGATQGFVTGVPNIFGDSAYYERFTTPTPGATTVGSIRVGLANYSDADTSVTFDLTIYNDDGAGFPDIAAGPIGGAFNISPFLLNVPPPGIPLFISPFIPLTVPVVIDSPKFHIGIEITNNDPGDTLVLITSSLGQGEGDSSNHSNGPGGLFKFFGNNGTFTSTINFDLLLYPVLGEFAPSPFITGVFEQPLCDTTLFLLTDTIFFNQSMTSVTLTYPDSSTFTTTDPAAVDSIFLVLTDTSSVTLSIATVNSCGRGDTLNIIYTPEFRPSPTPDFSKLQVNPVCKDSTIDFSATPAYDSLYARYIWDFGGGVIDTVTDADTIDHVYTATGQFYVTLTVEDTFGCSGSIQKLGFSEVINCGVAPALADFSVAPLTGCPTDTFTFTDTSVPNPDPATSWFWDFDDGNVSTLRNPKHLFTNTGTYTVTLYATNAGGTDTATRQIVINNCPLSSEVTLSAVMLGAEVGLYWSLPGSGNGLTFVVERAVDGRFFGQVTKVPGHDVPEYQYVDPQAIGQATQLWYRLRILDQEGNTSYSNVVLVELSPEQEAWLHIFPNPVRGDASLQVSFFLKRDDLVSFSLRDLAGRDILTERFRRDAGLHTHSIALPGLAPGIYMLEVNPGFGKREVRQVIVK